MLKYVMPSICLLIVIKRRGCEMLATKGNQTLKNDQSTINSATTIRCHKMCLRENTICSRCVYQHRTDSAVEFSRSNTEKL